VFKDSLGRTRIFHGYNISFKPYPYYPQLDTYDYMMSLSETDIRDMKEWGTTVVRLSVFWEAVEYSKGQYDFTFLKTIDNIIRDLGRSGIYTIIDSHQNLYSSDTCGIGVPPFYVNKEPATCREEWDGDVLSSYLTQCTGMMEFEGVELEESGLVDLNSCYN